MEKIGISAFSKVHRGSNFKKLYEVNYSVLLNSNISNWEIFKALYLPEKTYRIVERIPLCRINLIKFEEQAGKISNDHPGILRFYEWFIQDYFLYIVTEFFPTRFFNGIGSLTRFTEQMAATCIRSLLSIVNYNHSIGVKYIPIHPSNIFCTTYGGNNISVKLPNFQLLQLLAVCMKKSKLKEQDFMYISPELLQKKPDDKAEVWSIGVITHQLIEGKIPFTGKAYSMKQNIIKRNFSIIETVGTKYRLCFDFVKKALEYSPKRMSIEEALKHPWINTDKSKEGSILEIPVLVQNSLKHFQSMAKVKHALLMHAAKQVTDREVWMLRKTFSSIDINGDGSLSEEEFVKCLKSTFSEEKAREMFHKLDIDNSGSINFEEFSLLMAAEKTISNKKRLLRSFQDLDKDHSGFIDQSDIKKIISKELHGDYSKCWEMMLAEIDKNGDGKISISEYLNFMQTDSTK